MGRGVGAKGEGRGGPDAEGGWGGVALETGRSRTFLTRLGLREGRHGSCSSSPSLPSPSKFSSKRWLRSAASFSRWRANRDLGLVEEVGTGAVGVGPATGMGAVELTVSLRSRSGLREVCTHEGVMKSRRRQEGESERRGLPEDPLGLALALGRHLGRNPLTSRRGKGGFDPSLSERDEEGEREKMTQPRWQGGNRQAYW